MGSPIVSTITPCYRMGKYLPLFLEQLPRQTWFEKLEVVLDHNDPSDEEIALVRAFQKKYPGKIKHIIVKPVESIGASMNRCIREATGSLLTIWNVDDLRTPESIERQARVLLENKDVGISFGDYAVVSSFGSTAGPVVRHGAIPEKEFTRSMVFGPYMMFRKSLVEKAGYFDEQLVSGADFDLAVRLAWNAKAACAEGLLGYYLNEGLGASTRPNSKQPIDREVICLRYGIYDKLDPDYLPQATKIAVPLISVQKKWFPVSHFVPNYELMLEERRKLYYMRGRRKLLFTLKQKLRLHGARLKRKFH